MNLPSYKPSQSAKNWVKQERRTARFIRAFWLAAPIVHRKDPEFLWFLTASAWINTSLNDVSNETTRLWRNKILAQYLGVEFVSASTLAIEASHRFPKLSKSKAKQLLNCFTGITHHYPPIRPRTKKFIDNHTNDIFLLFTEISSLKKEPEKKIWKVASRLSQMPLIATPRGGVITPFSPLSPVLACLDPHRRFPIMNQRTKRLLHTIGKEHDGSGALALFNLIGTKGIKDSFDLDVYSQIAKNKFHALRRVNAHKRTTKRVLPLKSEIDSILKLASRKIRIRKEHNILINKFQKAVFADVNLQESNFDVLIDNWRDNRKLLIEAKTDWKNSTGRMQIRQAIGQLFDYRMQYFEKEKRKIDIAVLVPTEPSSDIKYLLKSLKIELLWFSGRKLCGTINI